jgi:hypothetical protein
MKNKDFRSMNNLVIYTVHPTVDNKTSANMGLFSYFYILLSASLTEAILWVISLIFLSFLVKIVLDTLEAYKGQFNFLYFLMLLLIFHCGALERTFGYGYLPLFYLFPFLFAFKILVIKRKIDK